AISPRGSRLFAVGRQQDSRELTRYDPSSRQFVPYEPVASAGSARPSPDGRSIVYIEYPERTLWVTAADGSGRRQLTPGARQACIPKWSPDGSQIAFHSLKPGKPGKVAIVSLANGSIRELLPEESGSEDVPNWSPDGRSLMFAQNNWSPQGGKGRIALLDLHA